MDEADSPPSLDRLRADLLTGGRLEKLEAIDAAALMGAPAAALVPILATFLTSEEYVPCDQRRYHFSGHAHLCFDAMQAIESIGTPPELRTLRTLLADPRVFFLPEASYDQGAYIGDYGGIKIAPAGLAARLVPLMRHRAFDLLPELFAAACNPSEEIGGPARRAFRKLAEFLPDASPVARAGYRAAVEAMAALPEAVAPTSLHGFELRDLAAACTRKMNAG